MSNSSFPSTNYHLSFDDFLDNILVDFPSQNPDLLSSRSDNSTRTTTNTSSSSSDDGETNKWKVNITDERKRKRMISNRESAKRSRKRKEKHLQDLTNQVTQFETGNHKLLKRLQFVNHNGQVVRQENERLELEAVSLQQRLNALRQQLANNEIQQYSLLQYPWPCNNNVTIINEQNRPTLTTF